MNFSLAKYISKSYVHDSKQIVNNYLEQCLSISLRDEIKYENNLFLNGRKRLIMGRSNLIDAVTYPRMNQKLDIRIMQLKCTAKGASIKKKRKERWNTPK